MTAEVMPCADNAPHEHDQVDTPQGFSVDINLYSFLTYLWDKNVITTCSCQGQSNVKHGLFGARHDHYGFITTNNLEDSIAIFRELENRGYLVALMVEPEGHVPGAKEYIIEFPPLTEQLSV